MHGPVGRQQAIRAKLFRGGSAPLSPVTRHRVRVPNSVALVVDKERILHKRGEPHNSRARRTSRIRGNMGGDRPLSSRWSHASARGPCSPDCKDGEREREKKKDRVREREREDGWSEERGGRRGSNERKLSRHSSLDSPGRVYAIFTLDLIFWRRASLSRDRYMSHSHTRAARIKTSKRKPTRIPHPIPLPELTTLPACSLFSPSPASRYPIILFATILGIPLFFLDRAGGGGGGRGGGGGWGWWWCIGGKRWRGRNRA